MEKSSAKIVSSERACVHCGTLFRSLFETERFCCSGCKAVFELLNHEGLGGFYAIRDANPPTCPMPVQNSSETYAYCDDPALISRLSPDGRKIQFYLEGMNCTACLWLIERLPQLCEHATSSRVNMATATVEVIRKADGSFAAIAQTLDRLGYRPHPLKIGQDPSDLQARERKRDLIRIGIAAAATGNIMILAVSLYAGLNGDLGSYFRWMTAALATPVLTYCAWPFYKSAWSALRVRRLNLDVPIVAAILAGIIISVWGLAREAETLYFDSLSTLVFLLLSSRFWLRGVQQNLLDVSNLEEDLLLATVIRLSQNGQEESVSSLSLKKEDLLLLNKPHSSIPIDGVITEGELLIDSSIMTGESVPVRVSQGQWIEAGSRVLSGTAHVRVERPTSQTRLSEILRDTERSAREKPAIVQLSDRVSQWFIGIVFLFALAVIAAFALTGGPMQDGLSRALALVIVTCPCVFGMAIPLSMSLAIRSAARQGIIIKDGTSLERLTQISKLFFDKTGTLTTGEISVLDLRPSGDFQVINRHLACAAAVERDQLHPVARALVRACESRTPVKLSASDVRALPDGGVAGEVDGLTYSIRPLGAVTATAEKTIGQIKARFGIFAGSSLVIEFDVGDRLRDEAKNLVRWFKDRGFDLHILSGDRSAVVSDCARQIGLSEECVIAEASPEQKSALLKTAGSQSAMIGDGANDAAALSAAGIGIAIHGSLDVSLRAADVYLSRPRLDLLPRLFEIATLTRRAVIRNLIFSAGFNLIAGSLALAGLMHPLWAAVLMPMSSLTVLLSALATGRQIDRLSLRNKEGLL